MAAALSPSTFSNEEIKEEGSSLELRKSAKNPEEETRYSNSAKNSQDESNNGSPRGGSDGYNGIHH